MTAVPRGPHRAQAAPAGPWRIVLQAAAALAVSMGIGRFVYTPILPLMHAQAGLSAQAGSTLATANYIGYLIGALLGIFLPALLRSALAFRAGLAALIVSVALMAATESRPAWLALRLVAGVASALVFVIAASAMLTGLRQHAQHLTGWAFGGVGAGIALSGVVVLIAAAAGTWRTAWLASAALALVLAVVAWRLRPEAATAPTALQQHGDPRAPRRWFATLFVSYSLEGVGYIIAGTFLVAALSENSAAWVGRSAWVLVGLAAFLAPALWARLSRRWTRPTLLFAALVIQAVGIALPAVTANVAGGLVSAVLFGATFLGVASLVLALGAHLQYPRAVALLTTGYSVGQILGPVIVTPLLHNGYRTALLIGAAIVLAAALAAAALRIGVPRQVQAAAQASREAERLAPRT
jgi:MFS family permease